MAKPTLSLCLAITKENFQARETLIKYQSLFDEIIFVIQTEAEELSLLAYQCGARLFNIPASINVIEAKNIAIAKASCDWLVVLDQDEELTLLLPETLHNYLVSDLEAVYFQVQPGANSLSCVPVCLLRMFRRKLRLCFQEIFPGHAGEIFFSGSSVAIAREVCLKIALPIELNPSLRCIYGKLKDTYSKAPQGPYLVRLFLELLLQKEDYTKALQVAEKGLQLYPHFIDLAFLKGICHYHLGQLTEAINSFYDLLGKETPRPHFYSYQGLNGYLALGWLGKLYETICEHKQAYISYTKALKVWPNFKEAVEPLIRNLLEIKSFEETIAYLDLHFDFNNLSGITELAKAYFNLGYYTSTAYYLGELEKRFSLPEELISIKVCCLLSQSRYDEARLLLNEFVALDSKLKLRNLRDKCIIYWLTDNPEQASKTIKAIELEDKSPVLASFMSDLHRLLKNNTPLEHHVISDLTAFKAEIFDLLSLLVALPNQKLLELAEELIFYKTGNLLLIDIAKLYIHKNLNLRAEKALQLFLKDNHFSTEAYHLLGRIYLQEAKFSLAASYFKQALNISPKDHASYICLSNVLNLMALEVIEKGLEYFPDSELLQIKQEELQKLTTKQ